MSDIVKQALEHIAAQYGPRRVFNNAKEVGEYFCLRLGLNEREVFSVAFLDSQLRMIEVEDMFFGSINSASVHPREVVKLALKYNAGAVVFAHNHPSGITKPSAQDRELTKDLKKALSLFEVNVVDHIVVGGSDHLSFSEHGLI